MTDDAASHSVRVARLAKETIGEFGVAITPRDRARIDDGCVGIDTTIGEPVEYDRWSRSYNPPEPEAALDVSNRLDSPDGTAVRSLDVARTSATLVQVIRHQTGTVNSSNRYGVENPVKICAVRHVRDVRA